MLNILHQNIDITNLSNFKTPAKTRYYCEINTLEDIDNISVIMKFIEKENLNFLFVWWWTNMLFAFEIFEGVVIKNNLKWWDYNEKTRILEVYSSENISRIAINIEKKYKQNLWHRFIWLPGSIWWAIFWNAWCFWLETSNNFIDTEVLNLNNLKKEVLFKKDMWFEYRNSILKEKGNYFLIKAKFDFSEKIEKYSSDIDNIYFREVQQPRGNTCWSFFKNPSKDNSAWKLIEEIWLKWYKLGWAYYSTKHANFLMNDWTWTYRNLLDLIFLAQNKVKEKYSLDLNPEVRIIYNK